MHTGRCISTGLQLITAVVCILLIGLSGIAFAETPGNNTTVSQATEGVLPLVLNQTVTPGPTVLPVEENRTITVNPPPVLLLGTPRIENLTCTIYGTVAPGSVNETILTTRWDWGDTHSPEYHGFPYSHRYNSNGTYNLTITALQSDGQNTTKTTDISVEQQVITVTQPTTINTPVPVTLEAGPVMVISAPVLTLLEPVIDGTNVTLNGNLNPGSPGVTIESVSADWSDGNITRSTDLPLTHQYSSPGIFTINITGNQSDGQSITKRLTLDLKDERLGLPGPVASGPPPNNDTPVYLIILATAIIVVLVGAVVQRIAQRRWRTLHPEGSTKAFSLRAGAVSENLPTTEELERLCTGTGVSPDILDSVIRVAVEIAREGREGQSIGTSFVIGDTDNVLKNSKQFVLNPFHGHHEAQRRITDIGIRGNIKEFAQLDGAFLITDTGVVEAAGRCITVDMSRVNLPGGLGSRHSSVAGITQVTRSIGVVVSQSGGLISIFRDGKIVYSINS